MFNPVFENIMRFIHSLIIVVIFISTVFSELSERDVLLSALKRNHSIQLTNINKSSDSLSLVSLKTNWFPSLSMSLQPQFTGLDTVASRDSKLFRDSLIKASRISEQSSFYDSIIRDFDFSNNRDPHYDLAASLSVSQNIPGGGTAAFQISSLSGYIVDHDKSSFENSMSFKLQQPVIQGAWRNSELYQSIKVKSIDNKQLQLQSRKEILSLLSEIRNCFWDYYSQRSILTIYQNALYRADEQLKIYRARFKIGESSILDTLSGAYEYLNAQQRFLDAQISSKRVKNKLAQLLSLPPESLSIGDSIDIEIPDLPESSTLLSQIQKFDPSLKIFEHISEKLALEKQKYKNSLLPSLDATFSYEHTQNGNSFVSRNNFSRNAVIGLVLSYSLPLNKKRISIKETALSILENKISREKYVQELSSKLEELRESWLQEKQRISLAEKSKEIAELQYKSAYKGFELGTIDKLVLFDAQNKLIESEISLLQMCVEMKKLQIILDEITGLLFDRFNIEI